MKDEYPKVTVRAPSADGSSVDLIEPDEDSVVRVEHWREKWRDEYLFVTGGGDEGAYQRGLVELTKDQVRALITALEATFSRGEKGP